MTKQKDFLFRSLKKRQEKWKKTANANDDDEKNTFYIEFFHSLASVESVEGTNFKIYSISIMQVEPIAWS